MEGYKTITRVYGYFHGHNSLGKIDIIKQPRLRFERSLGIACFYLKKFAKLLPIFFLYNKFYLFGETETFTDIACFETFAMQIS